MDWTIVLVGSVLAVMVALVLLLVCVIWRFERERRRIEGDEPRVPGPAWYPPSSTSIALGPARKVSQTHLGIEVPLGRMRRGAPIRLRNRGAPVRLRNRGAPVRMRNRVDPLWADRGWRREANAIVGHWVAGRRRYRGRIETPFRGGFQAYIWDPPLRKIATHPHRFCFQRSGAGGRYRVHFRRTPSSLDHTIASIEQVLREATGTT